MGLYAYYGSIPGLWSELKLPNKVALKVLKVFFHSFIYLFYYTFSVFSFSKFGISYFNSTLAPETMNFDTQAMLLMVHFFLPTKIVGRQVSKLP